jgi:lysophospholipase L1-like esterase
MKRFVVRHRRRALFAVVATFLVLAAVESAVRLGGWATLPAETTFTDVYNPEFKMLPGAPNPYAEVSEQLNKQGFRGPGLAAEKAPDTVRVISLGDSTTFGVGVDWDQAYSHLLETLFARRAKRVEVLNGGIPGTTLWQHRMLLEKDILKFQPDLIVFYTGPSYRADYYTLREAMAGRDVTWSLRHGLASSHIYRLLRRLIRPPQFADVANQFTGSKDNFMAELQVARYTREDVRAIDAFCREAGVALLMVPRLSRGPFVNARTSDLPPENPEWVGNLRVGNGTRALFAALEEFDVPRLDAGPAFLTGGGASLFLDASHFTTQGHRLLAQRIAERLCRDGLGGLPCPPGELSAEDTP